MFRTAAGPSPRVRTALFAGRLRAAPEKKYTSGASHISALLLPPVGPARGCSASPPPEVPRGQKRPLAATGHPRKAQVASGSF